LKGYWSSNKITYNQDEAIPVIVDGSDKTNINFNIDTTLTTPIVSIKKGWNLLSLPTKGVLDPVDLMLSFGFCKNNIEFLSKYANGGWSYYFVNDFNPTVNRFNSIDSTEGFWLKATKSFDLTIPLKIVNETNYKLKELDIGWNLIGTNKDISPSDLANAYKEMGYNIESIWIFKDSKWSVFVVDTTKDAQISKDFSRITSKISRYDGIWIYRNKGIE